MKTKRTPHGVDCDGNGPEVCRCGLVPGALQNRHGILCSVDDRGHVYLRAPRAADVELAKRVVAAVASSKDDRTSILVENIVGLREE